MVAALTVCSICKCAWSGVKGFHDSEAGGEYGCNTHSMQYQLERVE
jgi:hypothetical protein